MWRWLQTLTALTLLLSACGDFVTFDLADPGAPMSGSFCTKTGSVGAAFETVLAKTSTGDDGCLFCAPSLIPLLSTSTASEFSQRRRAPRLSERLVWTTTTDCPKPPPRILL
jgi:hypothetical protein